MSNRLNNIILGVSLAGVLTIVGIKKCEEYITIKPEKCENWEEVDTHKRKGGLWEFYMAEDIYHTKNNWKIYQESVAIKNHGKSKGKLLVPDLDNDSFVGIK